MNLNKLILLICISTISSFCAADVIEEAILNSDYDAVVQNYKPQEIPVNTQHAYWALADDTAKMRSNNLAFDSLKSCLSKKLYAGILLNQLIPHLVMSIKRNLLAGMPYELADMIASTSKLVSLPLFAFALADINFAYTQQQEKIKDAERIKFLIMNS